MSRLFSVLVSLFILFLVYIWINHITHRDKTEPQVSTEQASKVVPDDSETKVISKPVDPSTTEETRQNRQEPPAANNKVEEKPRAKVTTAPATLDDGAHLVVAGNFLERSNAEKHLKSIKDLGYANAEILNFEISQYYTVIAGRYDDLTEARRVAKKLKDIHSIDTYVRNGN